MNEKERMALVKLMPCVACTIDGVMSVGGPTEVHHCNLGGKAGQKRRGDWFTLPLCRWHHQGIPKDGMSSMQAEARFGPSLKFKSKRFRERYGSDQVLLERTNEMLGTRLPEDS